MNQMRQAKHPRSFFRLEYPESVRPKIFVDDGMYTVINLSEEGVKFVRPGRNPEHLAEPSPKVLTGKILFQNDEVWDVKGHVLRVEDQTVVLKLSQGLSFGKIMAEQRFLLKRFGNLRQPTEVLQASADLPAKGIHGK
ncbi:MAG: PilZ domain-containing protein [Pseudobacteriovorax sp.]|nr:PilZ domain-containing protein [Pseudobacteriovorax sp.]